MNLKRFTGRTSREALALVRQAFGKDAVVMSTRPCAEGVEVLAMASEGLQQLADQGLALACLTNKPGAFARPLLAAKGLEAFFSVVFGGDAFERKKPDPLPLLKTCEALGTAPARTLMVGDSSNDAQAARAAGCPVVLVGYGYNHGQPIAQAPHDALVVVPRICGLCSVSPSVAAARALADPKPRVILCDTLMGKGVPFLETRDKSHFIRIEAHEWQLALAALDAGRNA